MLEPPYASATSCTNGARDNIVIGIVDVIRVVRGVGNIGPIGGGQGNIDARERVALGIGGVDIRTGEEDLKWRIM